MKRIFLVAACVSAVLLTAVSANSGKELTPIKLPKPQTDGGIPLMQALSARETTRSFDTRKLPPQVLSNLLWAAWGINRPDSGKRTAPSAMNRQEIDLYVATAEGLYLYNPKANSLDPVMARDIRESTGVQTFTQEAPVNLIYVADYSRMEGAKHADKDFYAATDTGFISQNVYLYCASERLATVVIGWVKRPLLEKAMELKPSQKVILTQPVGYPSR